MKQLILIDGNSILFRAYYATAYPGATLMQTSKGQYTNALFAFVNMIEKMITNTTDDVLVAFDTKEPTHRHLAFEGYKAKREKMPDELAEQIPLIHRYLALKGIPMYMQAGLEADDIIGTFAKRAASQGYDVLVYSSDKDLLQLVDDHITVTLLKKGMKEIDTYTPQTLFDKYQLNHTQMIDLKALMGDPSDNIPGIPGVGEKTAVKLLQTYQTLDELLLHKEEVKGKLKDLIIEHENLAKMSQMLATITIDASMDINLKDTKRKNEDLMGLSKFFQELELHQFVKKISNYEQKPASDWTYEVVTNDARMREILKSKMAVYFELDNENYHKADLWGVSLSDGKHHYFIPKEVALTSMNMALYLQDESLEKYTFNYKQALVFCWWHQLSMEGVTFDLLIASYLVKNYLGKEEFKYIVSHFDYEDVLYDETVYGKGAKKGLPEDQAYYQRHIVSKAKAIFDLKDTILEQLVKQQQFELYQSIELPLSRVLADMEFTGLYVDQAELEKQSRYLKEKIMAHEQAIYQLTGEVFTISSPKQLGEILFEKLNLPHGKKTKTGFSTDAEVLESLKKHHEVIPHILAYRQLTKLHSTYIEGVLSSIFEDSKVHTIYMQALTATGRLSSIEPNLQNIPIRTEEGKKIRKMFKVSKPDHVFIGADYSQIELRILAHIANVAKLKEAFLHNDDIHTRTAQTIFHVDEVTPLERRAAKAVNFGLIYGKKAWSLADDIEVSVVEAQSFIDHYFEAFPEIKTYMKDIVEYAKTHGYVTTVLGRRRYIPELESKVFQQRAFGERTALNAPIQGSAADIIKKAMVDLYRYIKKEKLDTRILLQVHDELIIEVPKYEETLMKGKIVEIMKNAYPLDVSLETSCDVGETWFDLD